AGSLHIGNDNGLVSHIFKFNFLGSGHTLGYFTKIVRLYFKLKSALGKELIR
ncbi:MAG: hypothetical protein JWQ14_2354, partial [Adhaeribacter sp.]|nr:hypothetical protein [Adhaeribacter sp.]